MYAAGYESNDGSGMQMMIRTYAANSGALLWADSYDAYGYFNTAYDIAVNGGIVVVTGDGRPAAGTQGMLTRAYDAASGVALWTDDYVALGSSVGWAVSVSGGRAVVVGSTNHYDWSVRAYDLTSGTLMWYEDLDVSGGSDVAHDVASFGPNVFVVGLTQEAGTGNPGSHVDATIRAYRR